MKAISRLLAASALVGVAGCSALPEASLGGTWVTEPFLKAALGGSGFQGALAQEYQKLAKFTAEKDVNWYEASAYMRRGYAAAGGQSVMPWDPSALGLSGEAASVYQKVVSTINANRDRNPGACARAQALYDHWIEQLSHGQYACGCTDMDAMRAELDQALADCGYTEQVVTPPVVVPPVVVPPTIVEPYQPPVYVEPTPPVYVEPVVEYKEVIKEVIVEKPVEKIVYVDKPVEKVVYVDKPVETVREVIVEKPVEVVREVQVPGPVQYIERPVEPYVPPVEPYVPPVEPYVPPQMPSRFTIYFGFDRTDLTSEARTVIDEIVSALQGYASPLLNIVGHTDTQGSKAYNQRLAERRANAVANALESRGVPRSSMRVSARSELAPAVGTGDSVREALNRRVEIEIVE